MATGLVTNLPLITQASGATGKFPYEDEQYRLTDPFTITANGNVIGERLHQLQQKGTINVQDLPGYYKSTYVSRKKSHAGRIRRFALEDEVEEEDENGSNEDCLPSYFTIGVTPSERERLKDYIHQQRQHALMQYTLGVREESITTLEKTAHKKQQQLIDSEKQLVERNFSIQTSMKESQINRAEAFLRAEKSMTETFQTKAEVNKAAEELLRIKSAIEKQQQELNECLAAKEFFDQLAPDEWKEKKNNERLVAAKADLNKPRKEISVGYSLPAVTRNDPPLHKPNARKASKKLSIPMSTASSDFSWMEKRNESVAEEEPKEISFDGTAQDLELYFEDPQQVLDIFFNLEEQIFSLLQYSQEAEEDIERVHQEFDALQERMVLKIKCLKKRVQWYDDAIVRVNKATADVEFIIRMFSWSATTGETENDALDHMNASLVKLHHICYGDAKIPGDALQKLTSIEKETYRLMDRLDMLAAEEIKDILKKKQKENRAKLNEERRHRAKQIMETKQKSLLVSAQKAAYVWLGRKAMFRSPPTGKERSVLRKKTMEVDEEKDDEYYFT